MKFKALLVAILLISVFSVSGTASALTEQETQAIIAELQAQIDSLIQQINQLIAQQAATTTQPNQSQQQATPQDWCYTFNTNLGFVNSGSSDVGQLHTVLIKQGISFSPDTGNIYSTGTARAVSEFQERYASEILTPIRRTTGTGFFGDSTRAKLNQLYGCRAQTNDTDKIIPTCNPDWRCGEWSECINGKQSRTCTDYNNCGKENNLYALSKSCRLPGAPDVEIKANGSEESLIVPYGSRVEIFWSYANYDVCDFSKDLLMFEAYPKPNGKINIEEVTREYIFTITCKNPSGTTTDTVVVNKEQKVYDTASVDLKANGSDGPISVAHDDTQIELTWSSENASYCYASGDWTSVSVLANGQKTIDLSKIGMIGQRQYIFTVFCTNLLGVSKDTVVVNRQQQTFNPVKVDLKANGSDGPISVAHDDTQIELTWSSENATQGCSASGDWNASGRSVNGKMIVDLSKMWAIKSQYSFTITCINPRSTITDTVVVNRLPREQGPVSVDLKANGSDGPVTVSSGSGVELVWAYSNSFACEFSKDLLLFDAYPAPSGKIFFNTTRDYVFTITCTGAGGTTATDTVRVNKGVQQSDSVSVDLKANGSDGPISVAHNDTQIELTWSSENAIQCETFGDWTNRLQPINGQMLVDLSKLWLFNTGEKKYTFTITCRGSGGQAVTDSIVVTKSAKVYDPVSVDLKINGSDGPVDIANNIKGIELTWSSENASSCSTSGHWGSSNRPVNGQMTKDFSNTYGKIIVGTGIIQYTFTITCTNFAGTATDTVVVNKLPEAYGSIAVDIKANGSDGPVDAIYDSTESVKITWSSENATNCSASGDMPIWVPYPGTHGGVSVIRVKRDYTFTITCTNPNGSTATDSVVVRVGTPTVDLKINGSDGPINVLVDSEINIAWASVGASACSWQPGVWFTPTTGSKKEKIRDAKTYTYTITCRNTRGTSSDTVVVNGVSSLGLEPNLKMGPEFSSSISSENLENQLASLADIVSKIAQQIKDMLK